MPSLADHVREFHQARKTYDDWRIWWAGVYERWIKFLFDIATRILIMGAFMTLYKLTGSVVAFLIYQILAYMFSLWMTFVLVRAAGIREWDWGGRKRWARRINRAIALVWFGSILLPLEIWLWRISTLIASTK